MNEELTLQEMVAEFAADRLEEARNLNPGDEGYTETFRQAMDAAKICTEMAKADNAHIEEIEKIELEKEKQEKERELKKKATRGDRVIKAVEIIGVAVVAPLVTLKCNKHLVEVIAKLEEFEVWKTTAGKSLGKMFKFGK